MSSPTGLRNEAPIDLESLRKWLEQQMGRQITQISAHRFQGGQSNPTYRLDCDDQKLVLRRQPFGELLKGAHAVDREARVLSALYDQNYPVPKLIGLCTDASVLGSYFYVMELVEGRIFWDGSLPELSRTDRRSCYLELAKTLARLHSLDPWSIGLDDFGKTGGYYERQVKLWSRQYREDQAAGIIPDMEFLIDWLFENIPASGLTRVVHGDFRCDNVIFHSNATEVSAVLDWELSTLGDPLVDLSYFLMMYHVPAIVPWGLKGQDLAGLNIPTQSEIIERYLGVTKFDACTDLTPYLVLNLFRFSSIIHGIKGRLIRGTASSSNAGDLVDKLEEFASLGRRLAESGEAIVLG